MQPASPAGRKTTTYATRCMTTTSAAKQTTTSSEDDVREDDDVRGEADDLFDDQDDENGRSLEDEMRDLQANLGDDWILRVCVQGDYAWLSAEKDDGSQYVEAPAADLLAEVVELLNVSGGRSS